MIRCGREKNTIVYLNWKNVIRLRWLTIDSIVHEPVIKFECRVKNQLKDILCLAWFQFFLNDSGYDFSSEAETISKNVWQNNLFLLFMNG